MQPKYFLALEDEVIQPWIVTFFEWLNKCSCVCWKNNVVGNAQLPRVAFEIIEARAFLAEALRRLNVEENGRIDDAAQDGMELCWKIAFSLVRADYLKPSCFRPFSQKLAQKTVSHKQQVQNNPKKKAQPATQQTARPAAPSRPAVSLQEQLDETFYYDLEELLGEGFGDLTNFHRMHKKSNRMWGFRMVALIFGVFPEALSLLMILIAGVQYILWYACIPCFEEQFETRYEHTLSHDNRLFVLRSGFKLDSDTAGMEEIILATLAIVFIVRLSLPPARLYPPAGLRID